jgi:CheY-like chemotaxis protein
MPDPTGDGRRETRVANRGSFGRARGDARHERADREPGAHDLAALESARRADELAPGPDQGDARVTTHVKIEKILIVDDDDDIRAVIEIAARRIGNWDVVSAASGEEALEKARSELPDVILLDVMMPVLDGLMTLEKLREQPSTADIPVIFLTAKVQRHEVERYFALGARGVIRKPFDATTLPNEVRRILGS